ncbi:Glu/Leu/Phe/Val dehydrogenase, partial [Klebsiella pneumoniae]|nr:Glu/Leu/Phe/Val dehydrogenase [Klebsiella pneumoniae]
VFVTGREVAAKINLPIEGAKVAVQGFGNVGSEAAFLFVESKAKITHVQDHTGTIFNADGIDLVALRDHVNANQGVGGFAGAQAIADEDFWTAEVDITIPAALEGQITVERAEKLKAK